MARAVWNGQVIAESDVTEVVDGNHYFPPASLKREFFKPSAMTSVCGWKGTAEYLSIEVDGKVNVDAAWYYATPKEKAANIKDHVAFWKGVTVEATAGQIAKDSGASGVCSPDSSSQGD
ncbi:DUF427 domain-containing protein [Aureliella helgolandensis]|uniref:DUF427 domain-containing protein n=1 Tax=Aureliella helgolandensis TaxID=2527968 RepID=A0A518GGZ6_9BACT|nr:DUF427 domain-containing protein [Aureliella helgolandensis]QDV27853.1 hypothetical protein Q31a_62460 [Aureliella helgolandensis]|tara:strand:- start:349 stop:705 length:357 start_codon:yes stop_codon:yes gene_type:complete